MLPGDSISWPKKLNILVLFDHNSLHTKTTCDYLDSFSLYSNHNVYFATGVNGAKVTTPLEEFDAVFIHYSVRLCHTWHISPDFAAALTKYQGLKVLFIQDEYEGTLLASQWMEQLGINVVFTNVFPQHQKRVYPKLNHDKIEFFPALTGYLPLHLERAGPGIPLAKRRVAIGYRVRQLPYRYGTLGWEKFMIGQRMRAICEQRGVVHDIEWTDDKRFFGDQWLGFIGGCRATLGAESGSNVFDFDGKLVPAIDAFLKANPGISFDDFFDRFLRPYETEEILNHISPRAFESIALRTALILFEGRYCGVLKPHVHYLPLKKDFSNVDEILEKVADVKGLEAMTERAYDDIVRSGLYSYRTFINQVMDVVEARVKKPRGTEFASQLLLVNESGKSIEYNKSNVFTRPIDFLKVVPDYVYVNVPSPPPAEPWRLRIKARVPKSVKIAVRSLAKVGPACARRVAQVFRLLLLSTYVLLDPATRKLLYDVPTCSRPIALFKDLMRIAFLRRLRRLPAQDVSFRLRARFEKQSLQLVSVSSQEEPARDDASDWAAAINQLEIGRPVEIMWDHSNIEDSTCHAGGLIIKKIVRELDPIYSLPGLTALAQHKPDRVVGLLRCVLGSRDCVAAEPMELRRAA